MMIKRMMPVFSGRYDRVICRDADSLLCYRERQAVEYWITTGRVVHAITDSISHNVPLMGGMIGVMCNEFMQLIESDNFIDFLKYSKIDWSVKGADQTYLNKWILPRVSKSIVEHYVEGLPQSFRGECYNYIQDIIIDDIKPGLKESNLLIEHIGQSGFIIEPVLKFIDRELPQVRKDFYKEIDVHFKDVHYWLL